MLDEGDEEDADGIHRRTSNPPGTDPCRIRRPFSAPCRDAIRRIESGSESTRVTVRARHIRRARCPNVETAIRNIARAPGSSRHSRVSGLRGAEAALIFADEARCGRRGERLPAAAYEAEAMMAT